MRVCHLVDLFFRVRTISPFPKKQRARKFFAQALKKLIKTPFKRLTFARVSFIICNDEKFIFAKLFVYY